MQIKIQTNFPNVQRQLETMRKDIADKAVASALNKTVALAKTAMSREIRAEFNLKASEVNESLRISRASAARGRLQLSASLSSISRPGRRSLNLARFAARQTRKGGSFKIKRGGPRKVIPGSFLINGGKTVMIREGKGRLHFSASIAAHATLAFSRSAVCASMALTSGAGGFHAARSASSRCNAGSGPARLGTVMLARSGSGSTAASRRWPSAAAKA